MRGGGGRRRWRWRQVAHQWHFPQAVTAAAHTSSIPRPPTNGPRSTAHVWVEHLAGKPHPRRLVGVLLAKGDAQLENAALQAEQMEWGQGKEVTVGCGLRHGHANKHAVAGRLLAVQKQPCLQHECNSAAEARQHTHLPGRLPRSQNSGSPDKQVVVAERRGAAALWRLNLQDRWLNGWMLQGQAGSLSVLPSQYTVRPPPLQAVPNGGRRASARGRRCRWCHPCPAGRSALQAGCGHALGLGQGCCANQ